MLSNTTLIIFVVISLILLYFCYTTELKSQNCVDPRQPCINSTPLVNESDSINSGVEKIINTLRKNFNSVGWRRALLVSLIVTIIIVILVIVGLFPGQQMFTSTTEIEGRNILLVVVIIFMLVYLSTVYLQNCWWAPKSQQL